MRLLARSSATRSPREPWTKARAIVLLRLTLVIATSYLLLAQGELPELKPVTAWLVLAALASNIPLRWLPRPVVESTRFGAGLILVDTIWISVVLFSSGHHDVDFYLVYFFVLFLAAVSENLALMTLGTVLVSVAYLSWVCVAQGGAVAWSSPTLMRLPFFFAVAALYGFLADRVRRERETSERLLDMAGRDPLTDLPNRRALEGRLEHAIARASRTGRRMALLLLDLDEFKDVNDTYGHALGDKLLISIAERLQRSLRGIDAVGRFRRGALDSPSRLGGDEFAVVLSEIGEVVDAANVAERLCELISEPVQLDTVEIATTVSIGIALFGGENCSLSATTAPSSARDSRYSLKPTAPSIKPNRRGEARTGSTTRRWTGRLTSGSIWVGS